MAKRNLFLIWFFLFFLWGGNCPKGFVELDDNCYFKQHLDVLQDFIDNNTGLNAASPLNIGHQEWTNNRLTRLYLGELHITTLPDSIGLLKDLNSLDLRINDITILPEGICSIYPYYSQVNLSDNKICPPYPFCFDYLGNQNTKGCESFKCPLGYEEIQEECYKKSHIQVLQAIIDSNSVLQGIKPLELGKNIGYQQWENGKLTHLNLISNQLIKLPDNLCTIYNNLKLFDVSNNFICPPYPPCFEYIGHQNIQDCDYSEVSNNIQEDISDNSEIIISQKWLEDINSEKFQNDLEILQEIIDNNPSLEGKSPLEIGGQEWWNMRLVSLDLSSLGLTYIPVKICNITSNLSALNLSNNEICPPYPACVEYVDFQNKEACEYLCPDNYSEIDGECYFAEHLKILQEIIDNNQSLEGKSPLEIGDAGGIQNWIDGKLNQLILAGNQLTEMPESICDVHSKLSAFDMTNNFICPPYPSCIENVRFQNTDHCPPPSPCPAGYVAFDGECYFEQDISMHSYYYDDLQVLIDFTRANDVFTGHHPLLIGYQVWQNNRLKQLSLDGLEITVIPESIYKLTQLEYLDLNNNKLESLPDNLCSIYPNLQSFQVTNNWLCSPHPSCIKNFGVQNTDHCTPPPACPGGYVEFDGECYFEQDISTLKDFISQNESLSGRAPLDIGMQKWKNMRLHYLYLGVNQLTTIPESIYKLTQLEYLNLNNNKLESLPDTLCSIYPNLQSFQVTNNFIGPPYPSCMESVGFQNTDNYTPPPTCPAGYVVFDGVCYYYDDLQVLIDFTSANDILTGHHPLLIGYQVWQNNRLKQLSLESLEITVIPESIYKLTQLEYLNLNNNKLESLPDTLCSIYPNLQSFQVENNWLCPPYMQCFDFIGKQNTDNCEHSFCPYGYLDIDGECYFEQDISMLKDFISQNESLSGRAPLDIGVQKWKNMRLYYLYLGVNQLTTIPESVCKIIPQLKTFNISQNYICKPYPVCVEKYIGEQDGTNCP